ncbi:phosphotransferase [Paenibacillus roseipurpureus]|uniref:Phosphotransferase n=1 Tax=Paenibacillus roseopurpureus TaxID=2918901 RepID=A0AA96LW09_9BACL|nr:phosphotransferase [Paenibacillus sp. MBLB1832]WNR47124.1 phosphotransferase [Paenibacillus sp. MBLB1832]
MELEQVLSQVVTPSGELDAARVLGRQALYTGRNGRVIERFWIEVDGRRESFIFKPLTNETTCGRERWLYDHVLVSVAVRFPKLYAAADHHEPLRYWAIYEDMGEMIHQLKEGDYLQAAASIPLWHKLPLDTIPPDFNGDKPHLKSLIQEVRNGLNESQRLQALGVDERKQETIGHLLTWMKDSFETEMVISHGDYHQGNVARRGDEFIVLDWEFMHENAVFWDLYGLLDMSHPDFPKKVSSATRLAALQAYVNQRMSLNWEADTQTFMLDYHRYALVHSLWMLTLIEKDLHSGQWDTSKLLRAQQETLHTIEDCLRYCAVV